MTGFEYSLAGLMLQNGFIEEGESMVRAIRDRYDGGKRNPWNELECGSNSARSMASYALMNIYSGFSFGMTTKNIGFDPIKKDGGQFVWSIGETYGTVTFTADSVSLRILGAPLTLAIFGIGRGRTAVSVTADGKAATFTQRGDHLFFTSELTIADSLEIKL